MPGAEEPATRPTAAILLVALVSVSFLLVSLPTVAADGGASFDLGDGEPQLVVHVEAAFDFVETGHAIPLRILVEDLDGVPHPEVPVVLTASAGRVDPERPVTDATGWGTATYYADDAEDETVRITARSDQPGYAQGIDQIRVRAVALPPPPIYADAAALGAGFLPAVLAAFLSESGRTSFAGLLFPLYTRLKREEVLDHFVRGQIFGAVRTRPGLSFAELRRLLGLSNGSLAYHARILELQGFVRSYRDGVHRRYVPAGMPDAPPPEGTRYSDLQRRLLEHLRRNPGSTQRSLAVQVGVTQQCVSYNLLLLRRQGALDRVREGRAARYVVPP